MKNLIIVPVGMEVPTDPKIKDEDHWRWIHNKRNYETLAVCYNDFEPEINSYDYIIEMKGHKWDIMKGLVDWNMFHFDDYEYIGCVDDDLITDYQSFNLGLELANKFKFQYWQLSMPPDSDLHPNYKKVLQQDPNCDFSATNFIEMGSPFFTVKKFKELMEMLYHWDFKIGYGIDTIFFDFFQCAANVVHAATIHQPFRESYYDKTEAMQEMYEFISRKYPEIMWKYYGRKTNVNENYHVFCSYKVINDK
jgi:hypothetical protein